MKTIKRLNLQLFGGEGAGASGTGDGGGTATTGVNGGSATDATAVAEQRLRELGVPEDKIRKRASKVASSMSVKVEKTPEPTPEVTEEQSAPAEEESPTEEKAPTRMSWDEIMKDPEYNKQMQSVVSSRLKSAKGAEETLGKLTPALEVLARKYDLDPTNIDYDALAKKIGDDDAYYEEKALEMGVSVETAKRIDQMERNTEREKAQNERTLQEQAFRDHITRLEQQGEEMKKVFPKFDLKTELQNPVFARMTSPNIGISVEDAYHAVHRKEIQSAAAQITAEKTAQKISNAIQAGSRRPNESGTSSQAPSVTAFDYSKASREQREAFKQRIRDAAARGEKLYPGQ